jgi:ParB-like chromosome segregation protein Spo0J
MGKIYKTKFGVTVDKKIANDITEEQLKDPAIFIMDGDFHMLIDGWKRIYKAKKLGIKTINCYVIQDEADLKKIRL